MAEIGRIRQAQKMMATADHAIRDGRDDILRTLGFGDEHIQDLKRIAAAGKRSAFPKYVRRNNAATIRFIRKEVAALQSIQCSCQTDITQCESAATWTADVA